MYIDVIDTAGCFKGPACQNKLADNYLGVPQKTSSSAWTTSLTTQRM